MVRILLKLKSIAYKTMVDFCPFILLIFIVLETASTNIKGSQIDDVHKNPDKARIKLVESERIEEYHKRNYSWPLQKYVPDTAGWKRLMESRFRQVAEISNRGQRYEAYIQTLHSALLVPNFTEYGFGLARCPEPLIRDLRAGIRGAFDAGNISEEGNNPVIEGPRIPWFVNRPDLTRRVLHELRNYAETWAGIELTPYRAYGFRLYRNESTLLMHVDKMQTHIISFILHIDSSDDAEPWPIFIEDFSGRTHEVILTPGDILFYESSKCFHGRPRVFNGTWYSSLFVHYYPKSGWYEQNHKLEAHYAVPPSWADDPPAERKEEQLVMLGTSMKEPLCPDTWCRTRKAVRWSGPGDEGYWIDPFFRKHEFRPRWLGDHDEL